MKKPNKLFYSAYAIIFSSLFLSNCTLINREKDSDSKFLVTIEVNCKQILNNLSGYNKDNDFATALQVAENMPKEVDFATRFSEAFTLLAPNKPLTPIFNTIELRDRVSFSSTNQEVIFALQVEIDQATNKVIDIIGQRLKGYGIKRFTITKLEQPHLIQIEANKASDHDRLKKLITTTGDIGFWETYENQEVFPYLEEANRVIQQNNLAIHLKSYIDKSDGDNDMENDYPLFSRLNPSISQDGQLIGGPSVGLCNVNDTAAVSFLINHPDVKSIMPRDLKLSWMSKPAHWDSTNTLFELIAIKINTRDGNAPIDGSVITNAKSEKDRSLDNYWVLISKNEEGAKKWANLTADNIGRSVAITIDGKVYMHARVNAEIKGGRSSISGNLTEYQSEDIALIIKSGKLPAQIIIIE